MATHVGAAAYPVLIRRHKGEFWLSIKELALVVRSSSLDLAYEELKRRHFDLLEWAKLANATDELPAATVIPLGRLSLGQA